MSTRIRHCHYRGDHWIDDDPPPRREQPHDLLLSAVWEDTSAAARPARAAVHTAGQARRYRRNLCLAALYRLGCPCRWLAEVFSLSASHVEVILRSMHVPMRKSSHHGHRRTHHRGTESGD